MLYVHIYRNIPPAESWNDLCSIVAPCKPPPLSRALTLSAQWVILPDAHMHTWRRAMSGNNPRSKMFCLIRRISSRLPYKLLWGAVVTVHALSISVVTWRMTTWANLTESPLLPPTAGRGTRHTSGRTALPGPRECGGILMLTLHLT